MYRIPKWWRKFKMQMTIVDLNLGHKIMQKTTDDDGNIHISIEVPRKSLDKPPAA